MDQNETTREDIKALGDAIYRERVLRARRTPPEEKLLDGPRLFDFACGITMAGIRNQNPGADEATLRAILRQRLALAQRRENRQ